MGEIADPSLATKETLGQVREAELRAACAELGVTDVRFMDYRDSGMEGTPENSDPHAFATASDEEVTEHLVALLQDIRPDVVVTFEPGGIYGHPDHRKISRCATAAYDRVPGSRLYYSGPSRSSFMTLMADLEAAGIARRELMSPETFGVLDEEITTIVDVRPWLEKKRRALAAHRTQQDPWLRSLTPQWMDRLLSSESFGLVRGELTAEAKTDLVAGLG